MLFQRKERTIARLLDDPITQMVMRADGVDPRELAQDLRRLDRQRKFQTTRIRPGRSLSTHLESSFASPAKPASTICGTCFS